MTAIHTSKAQKTQQLSKYKESRIAILKEELNVLFLTSSERKAALEEEGPFVLGEGVMGAQHVPWGNVGKYGHAQEENAS